MTDTAIPLRQQNRAHRDRKRARAWAGAWAAFRMGTTAPVPDGPSLDDGDIDRRAKQIMENNPGYPRDAAARAARDEAEAVLTLAASEEADRRGAAYHLRARQLQAAYLPLSYADALEMARKQLENP